MYKVFSMDILGNGGGGFNSLLGRIGASVSNSGNSGVNNETIGLLNKVFTFNANDTEVRKNLHLVDGDLLINVDSLIKEYTINDYMRLLFEQPPAFETVSIRPTQTRVDISWNKGGLYDQPRYISFLDKDLPDVQDIVVKITNKTNGEFIYRTYPESTTSIDFAVDTTYPTQIQGGSASLTFRTDISYEFEVYARNSNTTDTHYYVQTVGPVQFQDTGTPGQPRNVSFASITADRITLTLTRPQFSDSITQSNEAVAIEGYRVVYEPLPDEPTSQRLTYTDVHTSAVTYDIASGNGENITIQIIDDDDQDTGDGRYILPLTVYQINSVSAKNTVNSAYGTEVTDIAQTRKSGFDYRKFKSVNPLANAFSTATKTVYNPLTDSSSNINYFTYGSGPTQLQHDISASSLYVNRTDGFSLLGKESKGLTEMVHVSVQWRKGTSAYVQDCFVSFNGYNTGGTGIEPATTTNSTGDYFQITNVSVEDAVSSDTKFANFGILGRFKVAMRTGKLFSTDLSASQLPYQVNYIVDGTTPAILVDGSNTKVNKVYTFYVDDLVGTPTITNVSASISQVHSVQWNHGIPSIDLFDVTTTFDLTNIGSQFLPSNQIVGQIRSNSGSQIRDLSGTDVIGTTTDDMIGVSRSLNSLYFTDSIGTSTSITQIANGIQINAINLNGQTNYTDYNITSSKKLHCDYVSFTKSGGSINVPNHGQILCTWDGTQTTTPTPYDDTTPVADDQLVYYNGVFRANGDAYKDWTTSTGNYLWSSGVDGFDYSGKTIIPQEGKWVVAKFTVNVASDADRYQITYSGNQIEKVYTKQLTTGINTPWMDSSVNIDDTNSPFTDGNRDNPNLGNKTSTGLQYYPGVSTIYVRIMSKNTVNTAISITKIN